MTMRYFIGEGGKGFRLETCVVKKIVFLRFSIILDMNKILKGLPKHFCEEISPLLAILTPYKISDISHLIYK